MLSRLLDYVERNISKEDLIKLFKDPKIHKYINVLMQNKKFQKIIMGTVDKIKAINHFKEDEITEENLMNAKRIILAKALCLIVKNRDYNIIQARQESCNFILSKLEKTSQKDIDLIIEEYLDDLRQKIEDINDCTWPSDGTGTNLLH